MLILGVVPVASAAMILQISVNGNLYPTDSTITLTYPSGTAELDIHSPNGWGSDATDNVYFGLCFTDATAGLGTISGGVYHLPPAPDLSKVLGAGNDEFFPGSGGIYGQFMCMTVPGTSGIFVDGILFHCEAAGDAVVQLWTTNDDWETVQMQDQVIIHQIVPEPATMVLLSLGGLLFRKRGK